MPAQYKAPKAIAAHPAVAECSDGLQDSDYRHDVWLKAGFAFRFGRNAGCRGGRFHNVREFLDAEPAPNEGAR